MLRSLFEQLLKAAASLFPNYALQSALSSKPDTETIWVGPHDQKTIEVTGVCLVTLNTN